MRAASESGAPSLIGREIAGRYRILAKIGEGGMGAVYRGEQISLRREVAVKVLRGDVGANPVQVQRFNAEAEVIAKLGHPNTVHVYDFGQDLDGSLFIAMELIDGVTLRKVIAREAPLSPTRALAIAAQIAASLADAHAHAVVHRDLKPDNVMLQTRGRQRDLVRVLDFGIAKLRDDSRAGVPQVTQAGDLLGTPQYMSPEQIRGDLPDGRTDIYALGCLIYEMVTARMPFEAPNVMAIVSKHLLEPVVPPSQRRPELAIPRAVDELVLAAMAKDVGARPSSMDVFGEQIAAVLAELPREPSRSSMTPPVGAPGYAPTPAPLPSTPVGAEVYTVLSVYGPAQISPTMPIARREMLASAPAPTVHVRRSRGVIVVIAVLVLAAGGGTAAWLLQRDHVDAGSAPIATPTATAAPPPIAAQPTAQPPPTTTDDPWQVGDRKGPALNPSSRAELPDGVSLDIPKGFTIAARRADTEVLSDARNSVVLALTATTDLREDVDAMAREFAAQMHVTYKSRDALEAYGGTRPVAFFQGSGANGAYVQLAMLVSLPRARLVLFAMFPQRLATDKDFQAWLERYFKTGIQLPP